MSEPCYAPTFEGSSFFHCLAIRITYAMQLLITIVQLVVTLNTETFGCKYKQLRFRMDHCRAGNSDPGINLNADEYERHVHSYRIQFGKNTEWEQWMLDNRDRFIYAFNKAKDKPETLDISFRYETVPIAYDPPWTDEAEHMAVLEGLAEACYAGYDFKFVFNGDPGTTYSNAVAGISSTTSCASGNTVYLYFESIFNHEFGHIMGLPHHYDSNDQVGSAMHMPPGETKCLLDRSINQFCSACRTALFIPLDVDNSAEIQTIVENINSRYPDSY